MDIKTKITILFNKYWNKLIESEFWNTKAFKIFIYILLVTFGVLFVEKHLLAVITTTIIILSIGGLWYFLEKYNIQVPEDYNQLHACSMILGKELENIIIDCKNMLDLNLGNLAEYDILPNWHKEGNMYIFSYKLYKSNSNLECDIVETSIKNILTEHLNYNKVRGINNQPYKYEDIQVAAINIFNIQEYDYFYEISMALASQEYAEMLIKHRNIKNNCFVYNNDEDF